MGSGPGGGRRTQSPDIHRLGTQGYQWVLDADIEARFDSIDHTALMGLMRRRVKDKRVLALVKAFLEAGVMTETRDKEESDTGTPQGGIPSPLLANIALSALDEHVMGRRGGRAGRWTVPHDPGSLPVAPRYPHGHGLLCAVAAESVRSSVSRTGA